MATTDPVLSARARHAGLLRAAKPDVAAVAAAKRELIAANCERAIRRALDAAPPITMDQRKQLAALLLVGGSK